MVAFTGRRRGVRSVRIELVIYAVVRPGGADIATFCFVRRAVNTTQSKVFAVDGVVWCHRSRPNPQAVLSERRLGSPLARVHIARLLRVHGACEQVKLPATHSGGPFLGNVGGWI